MLVANKEAVILIGHGGTAADTPKAIVGELKRLEGERQARREMVMSPREAELDNPQISEGVPHLDAGPRARALDRLLDVDRRAADAFVPRVVALERIPVNLASVRGGGILARFQSTAITPGYI